jgi:hypothetical protein
MKRLNKYIKESLLDDDLIDKKSPEKLIIDFIKRIYDVRENQLVVRKEKSEYVVDCNGYVYVSDKNIKSLTEGLFKWGVIRNSFNCSYCKNLTSLEGAAEKVGDSFNCSYCENLTSLEGAPEFVESSFECSGCKKIKTLEGAPKEIGWNFSCSLCDSLESLKGCPEIIPKCFSIEWCKSLTSLDFFPKRIGRALYCNGCGREFTLEEIKKVCKGVKKLSI